MISQAAKKQNAFKVKNLKFIYQNLTFLFFFAILKNMKKITKSAEETMEFACSLAQNVNEPAVFVLSGDLGAGKTTFTKGFAVGLGVKDIVTSPTFTIMNEYLGEKFKLCHFDMYRLDGLEEAYMLGFEEYFDNNNLKTVNLVEWAENVPGLITKPYFQINFRKIDDSSREISVEEIK